ncbi:hypothetical protein ASG43_05065 [Aureimonas sp. Leaf454]|uniref:Crp/Fnr family transcriptional regulator n=1 Tax=Aureimonas sp. Leaf454 TaxID=1736381 RepID=UPI0006F51A21|nr:Crp/Fnr family transcriptional regulator [Aureimonas sp. Leaf454]KQT50661.1 hypothetical protein ASG43_05065 [Aureimonas sp. Leaf454]
MQIVDAVSHSNQDEPAACVGCEARHRGICGALEGSELAQMSRASSRRVVAAGCNIGRIFGQTDSLSNILSGAVRLSKRLPDGRQQIVGLQFAPMLVGRPFDRDDTIEAAAAGPVRLCTIPRRSFDAMLAKNPDFERKVLEQTLALLDESRDMLMSLGRKTALERVASYVKMIVERNAAAGAASSGAIVMPLTRGEMADFLGLTIETVSRRMTDLRKMGIVAFQNASSIRLLSAAKLNEVSGDAMERRPFV